MPTSSTSIAIRRFQCRHIFTDGHRCGSPCLRGEGFCYYHHATRRPKRTGPAILPHDAYNEPPNQTTFTLPVPEDHSSIQLAIGTIMHQLAANALDPRRAGLLLYALQIASGNLANAPRHRANEIVQDITLDPTEGPIALQNELPEDARERELMDGLDDDDEDDEDDDFVGQDDDEEDEAEGDEPEDHSAPDLRIFRSLALLKGSAAPERSARATVKTARTQPRPRYRSSSTGLTPATGVL